MNCTTAGIRRKWRTPLTGRVSILLCRSWTFFSKRTDMKTKTPDPFYKTRRWQTLRRMVLKRDGYECQLAKQRGKNVPAEVVHHIFPREDFPEYQCPGLELFELEPRA